MGTRGGVDGTWIRVEGRGLEVEVTEEGEKRD